MNHRAIVIGGSLGGLTAALLLRDLGWSVDVMERSRRPLMGRGAGIVAHPSTVRYLVERTASSLDAMSASSRSVRYLASSGAVVHEQDSAYRFTSFFALYHELLAAFDAGRYHLGHRVTGFEQDGDEVRVVLAGGGRERCDLLVCADGIHSTARRLLLPDLPREYAGYVAWRGIVSEEALSRETFATFREAIVYYLMPGSHILTYPIPSVDGSVEPGRRLINWIWYRNVPPGQALERVMTGADGRVYDVSVPAGAAKQLQVDELRLHGERMLAPQLAEMVSKTPEPFVQAVYDIAAPRLTFGRACLIGDAASLLRPHVAVGTAKAAEAAWRLAAAVEAAGDDVLTALAEWEPGQLALEESALARTQEAGRRSQFDNAWSVGDPLPFGLYAEGDSAIPA